MSGLHPLAAQRCPSCRHHLDGAIPLRSSETPQPGQLTICLHCGTPLEFNGDLRLQLVAPQRLAAMSPNARRGLARMTEVVRTFWSQQRGTA